jgi:hypothetical protein
VTIWRIIAARGPVRAASPTQLDTYWEQLGSRVPEKAADAVAGLVTRPDQSVPFLRGRWGKLPVLDGKTIRERIARLDADQPITRLRAVEDLVAGGEDGRAAIRAAYVARGVTAEQRQLLKSVAARLTTPDWSDDCLRRLRVVEVLAGINSPRARELIEVIARGDDFDPAAVAARGSVHRTGR